MDRTRPTRYLWPNILTIMYTNQSAYLIEVDDISDLRLHRYHRTGTFEEIGSSTRITKVVNEDYHIIKQ